jgi:1-acyl-sn-glycerol-3-phosphate acyltransferase
VSVDSRAAVGQPAAAKRAPSDLEPAWSRWLGNFLAHGVWDTRVTGAANVPASGPVLLAANHTGVIDGPILVGATRRPVHVLVKAEMFAGPIGALLSSAGQIPIDRDVGRPALMSALAVLKAGGVVGLFPEGSRGRGDAASARAGIAWLALNGAAPVVPVAMLGTRRTGESVGHVPGIRRRLVVEFGTPILLERAPGVSGRDALEDANEAIRVALGAIVASATARTGLVLPTDCPADAEAGSE